MPEPTIHPTVIELTRERARNKELFQKLSAGTEHPGNKYLNPETNKPEQQDCFATVHNQSMLNPPIDAENTTATNYLRGLFQQTNIDVSIVADGVGGHEQGRIASNHAVVLISQYLYDQAERFKFSPQGTLIRAIRLVNSYLMRLNIAENQGHSTTIAISAVDRDSNTVYTANVGHSNVYLYNTRKKDRWWRLTTPDSFVADLVNQGTISPQEAETHPNRNMITQNLGNQLNRGIHTCVVELEPGDRIAAMTDGIEDPIRESYLPQYLAQGNTSQDISKRLQRAALSQTQERRDNMVIAVQIF